MPRPPSPESSLPCCLVEPWSGLGVVAGMTTRNDPAGGEFDLGLRGSAPVGEVMARWDRLQGAFPTFTAFRSGHQVHGTTVLRHAGGPPGWTITEGVDGHVTAEPGILLLVTVADCIPVYLLDPVARVAGLLHAGWRGTAGGILDAGVAAMQGCGATVTNIIMHCGIGICGDCYEVGQEVHDALGLKPGRGTGVGPVDLREYLADAGRRLGIRATSVAPECSREDGIRFFSHRRGGVGEGRMVAFLGLRPGDRSGGGRERLRFDALPR